ncbi:MAG: tetratricopeptide repeat protein, partial [Syntrophales bacterium]|nr:tetratricopeptide repeat protein [Syntrophales bacterium]
MLLGKQIEALLASLGRGGEMKTYWETMLARFPNDPGILHEYGNYLQGRHQYGEAIRIYEQAEAIPGVALPNLYNDWAVALKNQGRIDEGITYYRKALALNPSLPIVRSNLLFDTLYDPEGDEGEILALHRQYERNPAFASIEPFSHHRWGMEKGKPLRIGYLSSDFRYHAVGLFALTPLVNHDRNHFRIFCYYNGNQHDGHTQVFKEHADVWRVVEGMQPSDIARQIYEDRIDILVDLNGHTSGNVLPVLLYKPAPIQASWLGYVHSLGLSTVDYFITDAVADPPGMTEGQFVERLLRLPGSFLCFTPYQNPPMPRATPVLVNDCLLYTS